MVAPVLLSDWKNAAFGRAGQDEVPLKHAIIDEVLNRVASLPPLSSMSDEDFLSGERNEEIIQRLNTINVRNKANAVYCLEHALPVIQRQQSQFAPGPK